MQPTVGKGQQVVISLGDDSERVTARAVMDYELEHGGLPLGDSAIGPVVVFSWMGRQTARFAEAVGATRVFPDYWWELYRSGPVSLLRAPTGAPAAVAVAEDSLQADLPPGEFVIPGPCVRDEGTSYHYVSSETEVGPTPRAVEALRWAGASDARFGPHWTTDAPYRETADQVRENAARGVLAVDMEASGLYAAAQRRGWEAALLLVVSDEVWRDPWRVAMHDIAKGKFRALQVGWDAAKLLAAEFNRA